MVMVDLRPRPPRNPRNKRHKNARPPNLCLSILLCVSLERRLKELELYKRLDVENTMRNLVKKELEKRLRGKPDGERKKIPCPLNLNPEGGYTNGNNE